jgi:hypothetical protein
MHIASLQDNKKFAEDVSETMAMTDEDADHKFAVSVPNSDNYFPVLRYKCVPDLHPVPIVSCTLFHVCILFGNFFFGIFD